MLFIWENKHILLFVFDTKWTQSDAWLPKGLQKGLVYQFQEV